MPNSSQFRLAPMVIGIIGFLLVFTIIGLGGCVAPMDEPQKVCVAWGEPYYGVKGGTFRDCLRYEIQCLQPLTLDTKDGKLICRLREPNERAN
jgi:hypothetical protein